VMFQQAKEDRLSRPFSASAKLGAILCVILMSGCTSLEVGVHYGKIAYNKCEDLDNWQCLWYD